MECVAANARAFNGTAHPLADVARHLDAVVDDLRDKLSDDMQRPYLVLSRMRQQLSRNIQMLHNAERLDVFDFMRERTPLALDSSENDDVTGVVLDMLDSKAFMQLDMYVRGFLARRKRARDDAERCA